MEATHTGENICYTFISINDDYYMCNWIGYFIIDNTTNQNTFIDYLAEKQVDSGSLLDAQKDGQRSENVSFGIKSHLYFMNYYN